jgi:hypothetical protein
MILFLITSDLEHVGKELDILHRNYIKWNCNLSDFLKREYVNIDTMKPDTIVIDQAAIEDSNDLIEFQKSFSDIKIVFILRHEDSFQSTDQIEIINYDDNIVSSLKKVLELPEKEEQPEEQEEMQIGFLSKNRIDAVLVALSFTKELSRREESICYCEISKDPQLPRIAEEYKLSKIEEVYKWNGISFMCNVAEDATYTVCSFCNQDQVKKMFECCKIQIFIEHNDNEYVLHYKDRDIKIQIENPFQEQHAQEFQKLLGTDFLIYIKETKEESSSDLISEIQEEEKQNKKKNRINRLKKAGFGMILLFLIVFIGVGVSLILSNKNTEKKKQHLKKEVQQQTRTTDATTQTATEKEIKKEVTTKKTNKKSQKKITTSTARRQVTTRRRYITTQRQRSTRRSVQKTSRRRTTTAKKHATTKRSKSTTQKKKKKETFNVEYKVE